MNSKKMETVNLSARIPKDIYKTLVTFKEKFRPYMSINSLIAESVMEYVKQKSA